MHSEISSCCPCLAPSSALSIVVEVECGGTDSVLHTRIRGVAVPTREPSCPDAWSHISVGCMQSVSNITHAEDILGTHYNGQNAFPSCKLCHHCRLGHAPHDINVSALALQGTTPSPYEAASQANKRRQNSEVDDTQDWRWQSNKRQKVSFPPIIELTHLAFRKLQHQQAAL